MLPLAIALTIVATPAPKAEPWTFDTYCWTAFNIQAVKVEQERRRLLQESKPGPDGIVTFDASEYAVPFNEMMDHRKRALAAAAAEGAPRRIVDEQANRFRNSLETQLANAPATFAKVLADCKRYSQRRSTGASLG